MQRLLATSARRLRTAFTGLVLLAFAAPACADPPPNPMNRVSFQVEASREVPNDWIQALIGITDEDTNAARLANRVNTRMARALGIARKQSDVQVESGGYSTHPIYEEGKLRRWRASQDLVLESADIDAITALIGDLQGDLQLRNIGFSISPDARRRVEDDLIAEALAAFKARAEIVRKNLDARSYELVDASINTSGGQPPQPVRMEMDMRMRTAAVAPPALEGGSSRISVYVNGTIELE